MKREIKFRGKRVDNGELVTGDLIHGQGSKYGKMYILPQSHIYPKECNELDGWNVIPETVGEYTGLKDKHGKDIYEGDILQMWLEDTVEPNGGFFHKMYVRFTKEKGYVLWGKNMTIEDAEPLFDMLEWKECQIVGNIHDDPKFLNQ